MQSDSGQRHTRSTAEKRQRGRGEELDISGNEASKFAPGQFAVCLNRKAGALSRAPIFYEYVLDRDGGHGDDFQFSGRLPTRTQCRRGR